MKKLTLILMTILLMSTVCSAQYDPPASYTTYYKLRMWDEGDRPGADSINQNLKDIDWILKTGVVHSTGYDAISGVKLFNDRVTMTGGTTVSTGNHFLNRNDFMDQAPYCNYNPVNSSQLTNKYYVDNSISTVASTLVHITGTEYIDGAKYFTGQTTYFGDDANGDSYLNIIATDNAKVQFNGTTFLTWDAAKLTVSGVVNATGYQVGGVTKYLTSGYGAVDRATLFVSTTTGGSPTQQLNMVPVTINGITYNLLIKE